MKNLESGQQRKQNKCPNGKFSAKWRKFFRHKQLNSKY